MVFYATSKCTSEVLTPSQWFPPLILYWVIIISTLSPNICTGPKVELHGLYLFCHLDKGQIPNLFSINEIDIWDSVLRFLNFWVLRQKVVYNWASWLPNYSRQLVTTSAGYFFWTSHIQAKKVFHAPSGHGDLLFPRAIVWGRLAMINIIINISYLIRFHQTWDAIVEKFLPVKVKVNRKWKWNLFINFDLSGVFDKWKWWGWKWEWPLVGGGSHLYSNGGCSQHHGTTSSLLGIHFEYLLTFPLKQILKLCKQLFLAYT